MAESAASTVGRPRYDPASPCPLRRAASLPETATEPNPELRLRDYLRPVFERKWLIALVVLVVSAGTYAYYHRQAAVFQASTQIYLGTGASVATNTAGQTSDRTVQDQATLLVSRQIAAIVARKLGQPGGAAGLTTRVAAQPSANSDFIIVTANGPTAKSAADVANGFAQAFIQITDQQHRATLTKAIQETRAQLSGIVPSTSNIPARAALSNTINQLELSLAVPSDNATQLDVAQPPVVPISPRPVRNAVFAAALSLLAAIGLAYGLERFDRRLRRVEEFGPTYGLPTLALVPHSDELAFKFDGQAALGPTLREPFRQLRTSIQLATIDRPIKRILVTSAAKGEGKSSVTRNLAIVLREWGHSVAVVDADLRRPSLTGLFGQETLHGLTTVVTGAMSLDDAIVRVPVYARGLVTLDRMASAMASPDGSSSGTLSLLGSGPLPPNPQAMLASGYTRTVLAEIAADHDILLIDSPPILLVSDGVSLMAEVDAVVIVARLGLTTRDSARSVAAFLTRIPGANPIGIVVNDVPASEGYGYGYGSTEQA